MFKHLTDFGYQRSMVEAAGFYLAYLVLFVVAGGLVAGVLASFAQSEASFQTGLKTVNLMVLVAVVAMSVVVAKKKGLLGDYRYIFLIIVAGLMALWGGGILGLVPVAWLTTRVRVRGAGWS